MEAKVIRLRIAFSDFHRIQHMTAKVIRYRDGYVHLHFLAAIKKILFVSVIRSLFRREFFR